LLPRLAAALGGAALLLAVTVDAGGAAARRLGISLPGSIELIQPCIVAIVASALVIATVERGHAAVHLVTARLSPSWRSRFERFAAALSFLVFATLFAGEAWLFAELWPAQERGDLLGLPIAPQRALWCLSLALCAGFSLLACFRPAAVDG
jgi:TRAP-type C4-dicarboxylate transport system permease small subunit